MVKMGGRREGEPMSLPCLQPFLHKGLRGVTGGWEGSFEKLIFFCLIVITQPKGTIPVVRRY